MWRHEAERGRDEGSKDRPVVVLILIADGKEVVVAPITTQQPGEDAPAIEIPPRVRSHLGLDAKRCWITIAALNHFVWPGPDLRPIPNRSPPTVVYGLLPERLFSSVKALAMAEISKRGPRIVVRRTDV